MKSAAESGNRGTCSAGSLAKITSTRLGSRYGNALNKTPSTMLYTDAVAPIAIASVSVAAIVNVGRPATDGSRVPLRP